MSNLKKFNEFHTVEIQEVSDEHLDMTKELKKLQDDYITLTTGESGGDKSKAGELQKKITKLKKKMKTI